MKTLIASESITSHGLGEADVLDIGLPAHPSLDTFKYPDDDYLNGNPMSRTCMNCSSEFNPRKADVKRGWGIFCSNDCKYEYRKNKVEKTCKECGDIFHVHPSVIKKGHGIFCTLSCNTTYQNNKRYVGHTIEVRCANCDKKVIKKLSILKIYKNTYCSQRCKKEHQRGENSPNWKYGWKCYHTDWRPVSKAVIGRDKSCVLCGGNYRLSAHHTLPYRYYEVHRIDGCITLCASCHKKTEHRGMGWHDFRGVRAYA